MAEMYDVVIIGGGPGGSSAAIYTARARLATLVIDTPGRSGLLANASHVANYPGVPGPVPGEIIVSTMREQAQAFGAEFVEEVVIAVQLPGEVKTVFTNEGGAYKTRAVIIASGALERKTKIPGEEKFWGQGVSNCTTCDAPFYQDKTAIVAGSSDFAAEEALSLARFADRVFLVSPTTRPAFSPEILAKVQENPVVTIHLGWEIREILGDDTVSGARFSTHEGEQVLPADGIFLYLAGAQPSTGFLQGQMPLDDNGAIITRHDQSTEISRVYAVGDVTVKHVRQAVVAASEGCVAALAAERDLLGRTRITPDYH